MNLLVLQVAETAVRLTLAAAQHDASAVPAAAGAAPTEAPVGAENAAGAKPAGEQSAPAHAKAAPAAAESATTSATHEPAWYNSGALGLMLEGGVFMWPILAMGVLAAGVTIERWRSLKLLNIDTSGLRAKVLELLQEERGEEALALCASQQGPVPAVLTAGLRKYLVLKKLNYDPAKIEEQVVKAMEDYSVHIVAALERHLPILATISSVAPMVGSVGTVTGMIILFKDIVAKMGTTNIIEAAAAGIQVKLLVTVWGLIVGIPAYVAYNYFTTVINRYVLNVEESASELIEAVTLQMSFREQIERSENGADSSRALADPATSL